ncbi:hypothetical protein LTR15_000364 [Elasticomyces elasticus]|nr:hypothetical protein LTR15_000364 [Elasticomyces elasticus]
MAEQLARHYFHKHIEDEHAIFDLRLELATQQIKPTSITKDGSLEAVLAENDHLKSVLAEKEACIDSLKTQLDMMSESREIEKFAAEMAALQLELADERANQAVEASKGRYDGESDGTEQGETSEGSEASEDCQDGKEGVEAQDQVDQEGGAQRVSDTNSATAARSSQYQIESGAGSAKETRPTFPSALPSPASVKQMMDECATELEKLAESLADTAKDKVAVRSKYIILPNTASVIGNYLSSATTISDQLDHLIDVVVGEGLKGEIRIFKAMQKMRQYVFDREEALIEHMSVYEGYIQGLFDVQDDPFMQSVIERFLQKVETALRA